MFAFLQMVLVLLMLVGIFIYFRRVRKRSFKIVVGLCLLLIIVSNIANMVLNWIPMATEKITLTATGEKNMDAKSDEIALSGVIADGKTYAIKNAVEGKWFWQGDLYMWRNENDTGQKEKKKKSVVLNIPVGAGRELIFHSNPWRGIVNITFETETKTYDLYSEEPGNIHVCIPSTESSRDDMIKIGRLLFFGGCILLMMAYPVFAVIQFNDIRICKWLKRNWDKLFFIMLAISYVYILQKNSINGSLWLDEVWGLGWIYSENPNRSYIIYNFVTRIWFNLVPYGQENLLLLSQIFVALSIYFAGLIGSCLRGKRFGVVFSSVIAFSLAVVYQCAMEFRPYAMLFFCTTLLTYTFILKQMSLPNSKLGTILVYSVVLMVTMDTHEFGLVVAGLFMLADFTLIIIKKLPAKYWSQFVLPAIYSVFWLSTQGVMHLGDMNSYGSTSWAGVPNAGKVFRTVKWLCNSSDLLLILLIIGFATAISSVVDKLVAKNFDTKRDSIDLTMMMVPVLVFLLILFYSNVLNPKNSLFIDRYFISCEVFILYLLSRGLDIIGSIISEVYKSKVNIRRFTALTICILCIFSWPQIEPWDIYPAADRTRNTDYKGTSEYLMGCNDIYDKKTLTIVDANAETNLGLEYYLSHKGKKDSINHIGIWTFSAETANYDVIYLTDLRNGYRSNSQLNAYLDEYFVQSSYNNEAHVYRYVRETA